MRVPTLLAALACGAAVLALPATAEATVPSPYRNCTQLHTKYPHGLGRKNAVDHTTGKPVTTFTRDTKRYNQAISYNRDLDRDHDGIACEKR